MNLTKLMPEINVDFTSTKLKRYFKSCFKSICFLSFKENILGGYIQSEYII